MNIRVVTSDDALRYRELRIEALQNNPEAFLTTADDYAARPVESIASQLHPTDYVCTFGAFLDEGRLVGTVTMVREKTRKTRHIASVQAMYVTPDFRRGGTGRALLSALIRHVKKYDGVEQLRLSVVKENVAAVNLYQSLGFQVYGTDPRALKVGDQYWDELHMVLPLANKPILASTSERPAMESGLALKGFNHVTIDVSDLSLSLVFYVETLGMNVVHRGRRDAYLAWGDAWVCLQERPEFPAPRPQLGVNHVAFFIHADAFHSVVQTLRDANIPLVRGPIERGGGWTINFLDPDGTQLEFHTATLQERMSVWT